MVDIGTVTGIEIRKNKDGESNRRLLQVRMSEDSDIQTVEQFSEFGDDSAPIIDQPDEVPPIAGSKVIVLEITPSWKIAIAFDDNIIPESLTGERRLYSLDSDGVLAAVIKLLKTGIIEINGNADFAVSFTDLKTAFDQLKTDHDDQVIRFNKHVHATAAVGSPVIPTADPSAPAIPGVPSTADMAAAKVETVKLP